MIDYVINLCIYKAHTGINYSWIGDAGSH